MLLIIVLPCYGKLHYQCNVVSDMSDRKGGKVVLIGLLKVHKYGMKDKLHHLIDI